MQNSVDFFKNNAATAPVILWCEGGPGVSGMFSLFNENGPYTVDENGELHIRAQSWHLTNSMIFMDNPIGAGMSPKFQVKVISDVQEQVEYIGAHIFFEIIQDSVSLMTKLDTRLPVLTLHICIAS